MTCRVFYRLRVQLADVFRRGPSHPQRLEISPQTPEYAELVKRATQIGADYHLNLTTFMGDPALYFDEPPTPADVLEMILEREASLKHGRLIQRRLRRMRQVLTGQRTRTRLVRLEGTPISYTYRQPAWPKNADLSQLSPAERLQAAAWQGVLTLEQRAARAAARQRARQWRASGRAQKRAEARLAAERQQQLGLGPGEVALDVEGEYLLSVPLYNENYPKNWLAVITTNTTGEYGGLNRKFCKLVSGDAYYQLPASLAAGDAVEFGSTAQVARKGQVSQDRQKWHGFVVRRSEQHLILRRTSTGHDAVRAGEVYRRQLPGAVPQRSGGERRRYVIRPEQPPQISEEEEKPDA